MRYSNIFWALIFIISKHYAVGGMFGNPMKTIQEEYTDVREAYQEQVTELEGGLNDVTCKKDDPYRTIDGYCNSEKKVELGASGTSYARFFEDSYCDGIEELPCSDSKECLVSARKMSLELYKNKKKPDPNNTLLLVPLGQLVVHDTVLGQIGTMVTCCSDGRYTPEQKTHPKCDAIDVPKCDPVFGPAGLDCLNFVRTDTNSCKPRNPVSFPTHFLDASVVYGSDKTTANNLRTYNGGKLQSVKRNGREWLPQNMNPMAACFNLTNSKEPCYRAGDARVNQNTPLTFLHTLFLRFHNYLAKKLCGKKSCPWDDEKCYQEARRILIAIYQNIVYTEYLPCVLGLDYMYENELLYDESSRDEDGYVDDYSCDCDPSMSVECASAAFRGQHSAIPGHFKLYFERDDKGDYENDIYCHEDYFEKKGSIELSGFMNRPSVIEKGKNSYGLSNGLFVQHQEAIDPYFTDEIRHKLFRRGPVGEDLIARDIERSRDHGVCTFCDAAIELGILEKCDCWDDLKDLIPHKHIDILKELYNDEVHRVELMVGGMLERLVPDTLTGRVYQGIIGKQFKNIRCGDRYWYENRNQPYPFTPEQLCNLRQITMSNIICNHGDGVTKIPKNAFKTISKENPLMDCCDLPQLDFSLFKTWADKK